MVERHDVSLAELTTLRLGGPAGRLLEPDGEGELVEAVAAADAASEPLLLIAGGSNLVIADAGFPGTVIRIATSGVEITDPDRGGEGGGPHLVAAAGEPWDRLVARSIGEGLAGFEALSGIPGSVGATPVQNVGAYGAEISERFVSLRAYDRELRELVQLGPEQCRFGYRTSLFKRSSRYVVLDVTFELERSPLSPPVRYEQLAAALGIDVGERAPAAAVREAVLDLRSGKGMVIDAADADSVSAGSFFTNPILDRAGFEAFRARANEHAGAGVEPPSWPEPEGRVKLSAAWLIERAGFGRGFGAGRAGVSAKHSLALVNRGGATTAELIALAREIRDGVFGAFGVELAPEPTLIGVDLD